MSSLVSALCVLLGTGLLCQGKILLLHAANSKGEHTINSRSNSTSGRTVHFGDGESISLTFCLRKDFNWVTVTGVLFSNDGLQDRCSIKIDRTVVGSFMSKNESNFGHLWNVFRNSGQIGKGIGLYHGVHTMNIVCGSPDGVEVDVVKLQISDSVLTQDVFDCKLRCQAESVMKKLGKPNLYKRNATVSQRSYITKCAEEDNVHVPLYMANIANYTLTATLPMYPSFSNRREPDENNCPFLPPVHWSFKDFKLSAKHGKLYTKGAELRLFGNNKQIMQTSGLEAKFDLDGPSRGHIDSEIGSIMVLKIRPVKFAILLNATYTGKNRDLTLLDIKYLLPGQREVVWNFPDFTWSEFRKNYVSLSLLTLFPVEVHVEEFRMERRYMKPDRPFFIYKSDELVIEGVDVDFWWREPQKMKMRHLDSGKTWADVDYFRISRPVPWAKGYAQVFVLYQDGNARLLQLPPAGLDWIPFGSSMILGTTDPTSFRPASPIHRVDILRSLTDDVSMDLHYYDGGYARLDLHVGMDETTLTVSNIRYKNTAYYPFASFRSMYIEDGNSDCDRVMVDGGAIYNIMDKWRAVQGRSFTFFRQCESKHLTLSPDIRVDITGLYGE
ncbi:uncharacterized protein LOC124257416 [Haliotis rubra]|uniref:uncharacterized protein LOC124257416 n=1 Tax=Haliotis rubra TaxID=36100 RepID=UPI001EE5FC26|nr:uncharacterized protein LOC124257416 [Haliotis rubra]